jgi:hypothetical protein
MAVGIRENALGLLGRGAIGLAGQASLGHRLDGQRFQIRRFQAGLLGHLDSVVPQGFGLGLCHHDLSVQLALLNRWTIQFATRHRFSPELLRVLFPLPSRRSSGIDERLLRAVGSWPVGLGGASVHREDITTQLPFSVLQSASCGRD